MRPACFRKSPAPPAPETGETAALVGARRIAATYLFARAAFDMECMFYSGDCVQLTDGGGHALGEIPR